MNNKYVKKDLAKHYVKPIIIRRTKPKKPEGNGSIEEKMSELYTIE